MLVLTEEPFCQAINEYGRRCNAIDRLEVDHIVPRANGGKDERNNLQTLCHTHHSQKTYRENSELSQN